MRLQQLTQGLILSLALTGLGLSAVACGDGASESDAPDAAEGTMEEHAEEALPPGLVAGDPVKGEARFTPCAGCHGPDATGIEGLGKNLRTSEFLAGLSDAEAVEFLKVGRPAGDPLNTTGVDMPPKGGDPTLAEQDLMDIVAYLRTLE